MKCEKIGVVNHRFSQYKYTYKYTYDIVCNFVVRRYNIATNELLFIRDEKSHKYLYKKP